MKLLNIKDKEKKKFLKIYRVSGEKINKFKVELDYIINKKNREYFYFK